MLISISSRSTALVFDREAAYGMRLDLPAGTAVRFEPGEVKRVQLVALGGQRRVFGGNALVSGPLDDRADRQASIKRLRAAGFGDTAEPSKPTERTKSAPQPAKSPRQKSRLKKKKK